MRIAVSARSFSVAAVTAAVTLVLLAPLGAAAATYSNVAGSTVQFTGIQDFSGLWLQPTGASDTLVFNPTAYSATCPGASCPTGALEVDDTLTFTIDANPGESLGILLVEEWGTANVTTGGGIAQVGVNALLTQVSVTELDGTPVNTLSDVGGNLVFTPGNTFTTDGITAFHGAVTVDLDALIAAQSPGETRSATSVTIILNNPLTAFALGGTASGTITKDEFRVTVVPEPGTALLMALGLAGLATVRRRPSSGSGD